MPRAALLALAGWLSILLALHALDVMRDLIVELNRGWTADLGAFRPIPLYVLNGLAGLVVGATPFVLIEWLSRPAGKRSGFWARLRLPMLIWVGFFSMATIALSISTLFRKFTGIGTLDAFAEFPGWAQILVYIVLLDFFGYWFHRLEHASPFLWRFHSTHHSIEELSALNSFNHWFESMFRFFAVLLPTSIILPVPETTGSSLALIWACWQQYIHSDSPLLVMPAPLRRVFVDNLFHHYHHARAPEFHNRNFSSQFTLWDRWFGTAVMPPGREFPETGLDDLPPPRSLKGYLLHPFVKSD